jgi:hypothetical protein
MSPLQTKTQKEEAARSAASSFCYKSLAKRGFYKSDKVIEGALRSQ